MNKLITAVQARSIMKEALSEKNKDISREMERIFKDIEEAAANGENTEVMSSLNLTEPQRKSAIDILRSKGFTVTPKSDSSQGRSWTEISW